MSSFLIDGIISTTTTTDKPSISFLWLRYSYRLGTSLAHDRPSHNLDLFVVTRNAISLSTRHARHAQDDSLIDSTLISTIATTEEGCQDKMDDESDADDPPQMEPQDGVGHPEDGPPAEQDPPNGAEPPPPPPPVARIIPPEHRIQDLDTWLEHHGLRPNHGPSFQPLSVQEERRRIELEQRYQEQVHQRIFQEASIAKQEQDEQRHRQEKLQEWKRTNAVLDLLVCDSREDDQSCGLDNLLKDNRKDKDVTGLIHIVPATTPSGNDMDAMILRVPLHPFAATCATIFTLAESSQTWSVQNSTTTDSSQTTGQPNKEPIVLKLLEYSATAVHAFCQIVLAGSSRLEALSQLDDHGTVIVQVCQIAHFVQNDALLQEIVDTVLLPAVDTANCLSLLQLADQLNLSSLLERSLSHMMDSLQDVQEQFPAKRLKRKTNPEAQENDTTDDDDGGDGNEEDVEEDMLTPELRSRIAAIQQALHCSIHSNGGRIDRPQQRSHKLYFSSLKEYIAIFAERVGYYRERLHEAIEQQNELKLEIRRMTYGEGPPGRAEARRHIRRGLPRQPVPVSDDEDAFEAILEQDPLWVNTSNKIEKQKIRLQTLERALKEQKKLLGSSGTFQADQP